MESGISAPAENRLIQENPFEVTKAVDFTDAQIAATWVDLPGGGFVSLADPRSPMPMFLIGGKGGGRTHLLRYFSFALQQLRHDGDLVAGIRDEGYVGVYFRCGGLNSYRFAGKRQSPETWNAVFSYYTELWLGRLVLDLVVRVLRETPALASKHEVHLFIDSVVELFDIDTGVPQRSEASLESLQGALRTLQRNLDIAINNAALSHRLDIQIGASPGRLVFGVPNAATTHLSAFSDLVFAYLLDEFENLTRDQQKYVNTLIREKELPTTFLVGSRRFGLRTHETLSAGEENRQGSEFHQVILEDAYRAQGKNYKEFCVGIVRQRLLAAGLDARQTSRLDDYFSRPGGDNRLAPLEARAKLRAERIAGRPRPWLRRLRSQLEQFGKSSSEAETIVHMLEVPDSPLHEKFAVFLFYRGWADGQDHDLAAAEASSSVRQLIEQASPGGKIETTFRHYRNDLYAQLLNELRLPQEYFGFDELVRMSGYLPRNLLVVLKQITRWSLFQGEQPFRTGMISAAAQREGIREASGWFLSDAKGLGRIGEETQIIIRRLGSLFREMRFADKPAEVSCSAFSTDRRGLAPETIERLDEAVSHSLILDVPNGRRDKNSHVLHHKYQLNPMLAPLFDLSLALRGAARFSAEDLNAIFDPDTSSFEAVRRRIIARLTAPFASKGFQDTLEFD